MFSRRIQFVALLGSAGSSGTAASQTAGTTDSNVRHQAPASLGAALERRSRPARQWTRIVSHPGHDDCFEGSGHGKNIRLCVVPTGVRSQRQRQSRHAASGRAVNPWPVVATPARCPARSEPDSGHSHDPPRPPRHDRPAGSWRRQPRRHASRTVQSRPHRARRATVATTGPRQEDHLRMARTPARSPSSSRT